MKIILIFSLSRLAESVVWLTTAHAMGRECIALRITGLCPTRLQTGRGGII